MSKRPNTPRTAAEAYLAHLKARGIDWLFANAGTDFAPIIEALAGASRSGLRAPQAVAIAHETTAVGMAHGYYLVTGRPQAVMVHTNVGTANALMGLINAARDHVPMLFTSGRTPWTEQGLTGSRDLPIHWGQEMFDQSGMLRELVKWDYELKHPVQVEAVVDRALSIAMSEPRGPVYLSLPREALASEAPASMGSAVVPAVPPASDPHPDPVAIAAAAAILETAERPLIIAGGSDATAWETLAAFAERTAIPVSHFWPARLALPTTHAMHAGFDVMPRLAEADAILVLGVMVPWVPSRQRLREDCKVIHIGPDPAFARTPMRTHAADVMIRSSLGPALAALGAALPAAPARHRKGMAAQLAAEHKTHIVRVTAASGALPSNAAISRHIDRHKGDDAIVFNELGCDPSVMSFTHRHSYFGHPIAGGLGWGLPAALGAKLAHPDRLVIACVGDGSYMFANPIACHQTAAALNLPVLTIVFNNTVWNAVRKSTRAQYPDGAAAAAQTMPLSSLLPAPSYEKAVEASGGLGIHVEREADLDAALKRAIVAVRGGQQALLNVRCAIGA